MGLSAATSSIASATKAWPPFSCSGPASNRQFITAPFARVEVRPGSINDPASLQQAMAGITHVIHCAGGTKAAGSRGFYEVNQAGTRNVVNAVNGQPGRASGSCIFPAWPPRALPGPPNPRAKRTPPPVSEYGKSKLAGELEVRDHCRAEYVILRPPAVYGPRDAEFLRLFKAVRRHLLPRPRAAGLKPGFCERPGGSRRDLPRATLRQRARPISSPPGKS